MNKEIIKDCIQWDVKSWSIALSYWNKSIDWDKIETGLELGGREGGLSLWLALKGKNIVCSDLKDVKITAEKLHLLHNVSSCITYQDIDATNIPYENYFDVIVFKSIIGGIGRNDNFDKQKLVFSEIYKALKPGGILLFAENLMASPFHQKLRKVFVNWGSSWRYVSLNEMHVLLSDFSTFDLRTTGFLGAFGRTEQQRNFLSTIDQLLLNKICPESWKYIGYGIAEK
jgi:SAM-dependent methyltransferase